MSNIYLGHKKSLRMNALMMAVMAMAEGIGGALPAYSRAAKNTDNRPHNGPRECARRRGGNHWKSFRDADRVARGLPSLRRVEQIFSPD